MNSKPTIQQVLDLSRSRAMGRISQKEIKPNVLIRELFRTFDIAKKKGKATEVEIRGRIQDIVFNNVIPASGRFHFNDFLDDGFILDIQKEFRLKHKRSN
jgi:hypothetical protein